MKSKEKWSDNPNGNVWSKDETKVAHRMMEKMGWSKGKGLGKNEDGDTEHIKVSKKNDTKGMGYKGYDGVWLEGQKEFSQLLENLNGEHNSDSLTELKSLEERSQKSSKRIHRYHKVIKGKDLSSKSKADLEGIFGKTPEKPQEEKRDDDDDDKKSTENLLLVNSGNMNDYFMNKMKAKKMNDEGDESKVPKKSKKNKKAVHSDNEERAFPNGKSITEASETENEEKRKKKKKRKTTDENDKQFMTERKKEMESNMTETFSSEKKSKKRKRTKESEIDATCEPEGNETDYRKKKKTRQTTEENEEEIRIETETNENLKKEKKKKKKIKPDDDDKFTEISNDVKSKIAKKKKKKKAGKSNDSDAEHKSSDELNKQFKKTKRKKEVNTSVIAEESQPTENNSAQSKAHNLITTLEMILWDFKKGRLDIKNYRPAGQKYKNDKSYTTIPDMVSLLQNYSDNKPFIAQEATHEEAKGTSGDKISRPYKRKSSIRQEKIISPKKKFEEIEIMITKLENFKTKYQTLSKVECNQQKYPGHNEKVTQHHTDKQGRLWKNALISITLSFIADNKYAKDYWNLKELQKDTATLETLKSFKTANLFDIEGYQHY